MMREVLDSLTNRIGLVEYPLDNPRTGRHAGKASTSNLKPRIESRTAQQQQGWKRNDDDSELRHLYAEIEPKHADQPVPAGDAEFVESGSKREPVIESERGCDDCFTAGKKRPYRVNC